MVKVHGGLGWVTCVIGFLNIRIVRTRVSGEERLMIGEDCTEGLY
jgi:hypothetical protein